MYPSGVILVPVREHSRLEQQALPWPALIFKLTFFTLEEDRLTRKHK